MQIRSGKQEEVCPKRKRRIKKQYAKTAKNRVKGADEKQKWKAGEGDTAPTRRQWLQQDVFCAGGFSVSWPEFVNPLNCHTQKRICLVRDLRLNIVVFRVVFNYRRFGKHSASLR